MTQVYHLQTDLDSGINGFTVCMIMHCILAVTTYHFNRQITEVNISQNCTTDTAAIDSTECVCKPWEKKRHNVKQSSEFVGIPVKTNVSSCLISQSLHCRLIFHKVVILKYMKSKWCIPVNLRCIYMVSLMQECL